MAGRQLTADSLEAVVVHSDLRRTGHFECSDDLLNQLHANAVWGLRGNFLDVPTDCPQRDERLGWTGDIAVFAPSAAFLYDVDDFLRDWLVDLALEQQAQDGLVPFVVPDVLKYEEHPTEFPAPETAAIWSDAAAWVPWALWQAYGDRRGAGGPVRLDGRPPDPRRVAALAVAGCGTPASSSATGWTRRRRPTGRSSRRPTTAWWPPRASTGPPASWPSPRR